MAAISPVPFLQFIDANGNPLSGGKLYTYVAGTTTPLATYTTSAGNIANTNPVILDSAGRASVWLGSGAYKFVLKDSTDVLVYTTDNIVGTYGVMQPAVVATAGQTIFTVLPYVMGGSAIVAVNGLTEEYNVAYTETNTTTITFVAPGLSVGDRVTVRSL
jgi:hypothetical protein|tara:strand:+ start:1992 stop:2471 length:480 start_codon:yes stop_codon:yes gene_type:complete